MTNDFKKFIFKASIFSIPFIIMVIVAIIIDPFKVWFNYDDYYKNNFATLNRELVCLKLFEKNVESVKYNSYIFGSSRSQAYKVPEWKKHLDSNAVGFHFDSSGEGIYGIYNKIRYIKSNGLPINNALIILDYDTMKTQKNRKGYLFISPPELSLESEFAFYKEFLISNFNPTFIIGYIDYKIFNEYRSYMSDLFNHSKYDNVSNNITADLYYGYDKMIQEDKESYYDNLVKKGIFYDRSDKKLLTEEIISKDEVTLLKDIQNLLNKDGTKYKIVISPLYDERKLSQERLHLLKNIFGDSNVYDFSGKNKYTASIYNYYEDSHYRPHVSNEIMDEIYKK